MSLPALPVVVIVLLMCLFLEGTGALKCRTEDGPSSDEVRKVLRTCMRRISSDTNKNKTSEADDEDEYGNYDSSYSDSGSEGGNGEAGSTTGETVRRQTGPGSGSSGGSSGQMSNTRGRNNGEDRNGSRDSSRNGNDHRGNGRNREDGGGKRRDREWDYNYGSAMERRVDGRGRYKRQYYNDGVQQGGYGYGQQQSNDRYNRDRDNFMNPSTGNSSGNGTNNLERDRACLMQCFFQEMKMTNSEGFPDKHKVLHVVTKDLRDYELRDFYTDSIQECFHMISMDNRIRDKCDYSMKFVTCLADRGQANCNDWENETIIF